MTGRNLLYIFGVILFLGWSLQFVINLDHYSNSDIITGMIFICVVLAYYFLSVYLYHKSPLGQKIVLYSLFIVAVISVSIAIFYEPLKSIFYGS
ncbi:hypothetical protein [Bacillus haynesii]|uniref:hypothetical protein n=1 Tax=Bacillus haynesii TaxID=1925021 RepID=UPI00227DC107|nr:hypothetical protein [Bacillus haynesii]MCY8000124.1 hypothetical protein [Bacillus haynesii]